MHAQNVGDIQVHFATEVAVPNHLLQPGDYVFRRLNDANPNVYEILSNNGQDPVGIFEVMSTQRIQRGDTEVELSAPDAAGVRLVQAWYGPGDTDGYQLSYTRKDVSKLDELARTEAQNSGSFAGQP
jgi:hypothetical protein